MIVIFVRLKAFTVIDNLSCMSAGVYSSYESAGINLEYLMEKDAMGKATIYLCDQTISPVPHLSVRLAAIKIRQSDYGEYPE